MVDTVRAAGAVVFGKTNVPRWSGDYQSTNEMFGTTNNPWDLARTPGGSSGGPAAAVAMGFTPFEIGTDIGGSIRVPSSFCGVYGHKPSFGIIPTYGYLDHPTLHRNVADVNVFGPIARSVDDLEFLLDLLAAPNPDDAPAWRLDLPEARSVDIAGFRVAAWLDDAFCPVDPAVLDVLSAAIDRLEQGGARIDHSARPAIDPARAALVGAGLISVATSISDTDDEFASALAVGHALPHRSWDLLRRERGELRQRWAEFFTDVDILLCPVTPVPPFRHVQSADGPNWIHSTLADHGEGAVDPVRSRPRTGRDGTGGTGVTGQSRMSTSVKNSAHRWRSSPRSRRSGRWEHVARGDADANSASRCRRSTSPPRSVRRRRAHASWIDRRAGRVVDAGTALLSRSIGGGQHVARGVRPDRTASSNHARDSEAGDVDRAGLRRGAAGASSAFGAARGRAGTRGRRPIVRSGRTR